MLGTLIVELTRMFRHKYNIWNCFRIKIIRSRYKSQAMKMKVILVNDSSTHTMMKRWKSVNKLLTDIFSWYSVVTANQRSCHI